MVRIKLKSSPPSTLQQTLIASAGSVCISASRGSLSIAAEQSLCWAQLRSEANGGSGLWLAESHHESLFPLNSHKANRSALLDTETVHRMCCCGTSRWCFCCFSISVPHKYPTVFVSNHADTQPELKDHFGLFNLLSKSFWDQIRKKKPAFFRLLFLQL